MEMEMYLDTQLDHSDRPTSPSGSPEKSDDNLLDQLFELKQQLSHSQETLKNNEKKYRELFFQAINLNCIHIEDEILEKIGGLKQILATSNTPTLNLDPKHQYLLASALFSYSNMCKALQNENEDLREEMEILRVENTILELEKDDLKLDYQNLKAVNESPSTERIACSEESKQLIDELEDAKKELECQNLGLKEENDDLRELWNISDQISENLKGINENLKLTIEDEMTYSSQLEAKLEISNDSIVELKNLLRNERERVNFLKTKLEILSSSQSEISMIDESTESSLSETRQLFSQEVSEGSSENAYIHSAIHAVRQRHYEKFISQKIFNQDFKIERNLSHHLFTCFPHFFLAPGSYGDCLKFFLLLRRLYEQSLLFIELLLQKIMFNVSHLETCTKSDVNNSIFFISAVECTLKYSRFIFSYRREIIKSDNDLKLKLGHQFVEFNKHIDVFHRCFTDLAREKLDEETTLHALSQIFNHANELAKLHYDISSWNIITDLEQFNTDISLISSSCRLTIYFLQKPDAHDADKEESLSSILSQSCNTIEGHLTKLRSAMKRSSNEVMVILPHETVEALTKYQKLYHESIHAVWDLVMNLNSPQDEPPESEVSTKSQQDMSQKCLESFKLVSENLDELLTSVISDLSSGVYDSPKSEETVSQKSIDDQENASMSSFCKNYCDVHIKTQSNTESLLENYLKRIKELECQLNETSEQLNEVLAKNQLLQERSEAISLQSRENIENLKKLLADQSAEACERKRKQEELSCQVEGLKKNLKELEEKSSNRPRPSERLYHNLQVSVTSNVQRALPSPDSSTESFIHAISSELSTLRLCLSLIREENKDLRLQLLSCLDTDRPMDYDSQLVQILSSFQPLDHSCSVETILTTSPHGSSSLYIKLLKDYTDLETKLRSQTAKNRVITLKDCSSPSQLYETEQFQYLQERHRLKETIKQISSSLQRKFDENYMIDQNDRSQTPVAVPTFNIDGSMARFRVKSKINALRFYLDLQANSIFPGSESMRISVSSEAQNC